MVGLELHLVVSTGDAAAVAVRVDHEVDATVAEFLAACQAHLGRTENTRVTVERTGTVLAETGSMVAADVRNGDRLVFGPPPPPLIRLVLESGAPARTFELGPGRHTIGRAGASVDLALGDDSVSRAHCRIDIDEAGQASVVDLGSSNGTWVDDVEVQGATPLGDGALMELGRLGLRVHGAVPASAEPTPDEGTAPVVAFHRPPRLLSPVVSPEVRLPVPPAEPSPRRIPLAAAAIPLVIGVALYLLTRQVTTLAFALVAPAMLVGSVLEDRRSGRLTYRDRRATYDTQVALTQDRVREALDAERTDLLDRWPAPSALVARAADVDARLWERLPSHADFLHLRVGLGPVPPTVTGAVRTTSSDDESLALHGRLTDTPLDAAPVRIDLSAPRAVGICGPEDRRRALARALELQLLVLHGPADVQIISEDRPSPSPVSMSATTVAITHLAGRSTAARAGSGPGSGEPRREVWCAQDRRGLPGRCDVVVELTESGATLHVEGSPPVVGLVVDQLDDVDLQRARTALATVVDADQGQTSPMPDSVALSTLFGAAGPTASTVTERWNRADRGLVATLGEDGAGPVTVDLRRDGPHALIAGTTGSGKSELLQSLVATLAAAYPPSRLTFLLIDYKGGTAFRAARDLPHTVGFVTDLDGHLAHRALAALDAEVRRRERLVFDHGAPDLIGLEERHPDAAPPALVVVVDEFAALAQEVPAFVDGVVDLAQRGRGLGIHVVLATQRPAGVVTDRIRANIGLRIALRVTDRQESNDVIDAPIAADIPSDRPGRAYLRRGRAEPTEVQTLWAGATDTGGAIRQRVTVRDASDSAVRPPSPKASDLERLVAGVREAFDRSGAAAPRRPWLPPLPTMLDLDQVLVSHPSPSIDEPTIGLLDDPVAQRQGPITVDLSAGGAIVYGTSRSGLSTVLRTLAVAAAVTTTPDHLQIYGIDFGSRSLAVLEALPHCGAVVSGDDPDRVVRLLALLRRQATDRRERLAGSGVSSIDDLPASAGPVPRLLVLIDDYAAFTAAYERVDLGEHLDAVAGLASTGPALGIHLAVTAPRRAAVPGTLASVLPTRLVLRMAEREEMTMVGADPGLVRSMAFGPGRGIAAGAFEFQTAVLGGRPGTSELDAIRARGAELARRHPGRSAPGVGLMPTRVPYADLPEAPSLWRVPMGVHDDAESIVWLDLGDSHALVAGPQRSGRSTALATIATPWLAEGAHIRLLAARRTPLLALEGWRHVGRSDDALAFVAALDALLDTRSDDPDAEHEPVLVVVDDADELAPDVASRLEAVVRRSRDLAVRVVAAAEVRAAHRAFSGPLAELRKAKCGVILRPESDVDGDLLGVRLRRRGPEADPPGRGVAVAGGSAQRLQVATPFAT